MTHIVDKGTIAASRGKTSPKQAMVESACSHHADPEVVQASVLVLDEEDGDMGVEQETLDESVVEADFVDVGTDIDIDDEANSGLLQEHASSDLPSVAQNSMPARSQDGLQLYLREINRFPMLEPDEESELARRVKEDGDRDAAKRLITSHLRLVVKIAMEFQRRWMQNVLDLIQEGNVGLLRAVNKFDVDKDIKFSYYATYWIRAYILKFIMDNCRMVKIGTTQAQRKLFYNLRKEQQRLQNQGFDPDPATLAGRLGVKPDQVIEMGLRLNGQDVSLNTRIGDDPSSEEKITNLPALGPGVEESLGAAELATLVREKLGTIVSSLSEKERYILKYRLMTDNKVTLRAIGEHFGITRERVRQIESRLLEKLREHMKSLAMEYLSDWRA